MKNNFLPILKSIFAVSVAGFIFLAAYNYYPNAGIYCAILTGIIYVAFLLTENQKIFRAVLFLLLSLTITGLYTYHSVNFLLSGISYPKHNFAYDFMGSSFHLFTSICFVFEIKNHLQ